MRPNILGWCSAVTLLGGVVVAGCGNDKWIGEGEKTPGGAAGNGAATSGNAGVGPSGGGELNLAGKNGGGGASDASIGSTGGDTGEPAKGGSAGGSGVGSNPSSLVQGGQAGGNVAGAGGVPSVPAGGTAVAGAGGIASVDGAGAGGGAGVSAGGVTGVGGATEYPTGACVGLDGEWTVTPTVTTRTNAGALLPNVGQQLSSMGLRFTPTETGGCNAEFLPDWSPPWTIELVSSEGKLVLPDTYRPVLMYAPLRCRSSISDWLFKQLSINAVGVRSFHWDAEVSYLPLGFDTRGTATYSLDGNLTPGLPPLQWVAHRDITAPRDWCSAAPIATSVTELLPWEKVNVHYSQPIGVTQPTLSASIAEQNVSLNWTLPSDSPQRQLTDNRAPSGFTWEQRRLAGSITDRNQVMGKTVQVTDAAHALPPLSFSFASPPLAKGYVGEALRQLVTHGTAEYGNFLEVEGLHVINRNQSRDIHYAAGRLDVTGRSKVTVQLRVPIRGAPADYFMPVEGIDAAGASLPFTMTNATKAPPPISGVPGTELYYDRTYELVLSGQSELAIVINEYDDAGNMGMQVNFTLVGITAE